MQNGKLMQNRDFDAKWNIDAKYFDAKCIFDEKSNFDA